MSICLLYILILIIVVIVILIVLCKVPGRMGRPPKESAIGCRHYRFRILGVFRVCTVICMELLRT